MSFLSHGNSQETARPITTPEPHAVRRAVRHKAAQTTMQALKASFGAGLFAAQFATAQAASPAQARSTGVSSDDSAAQAA